MNPGLTNPNLMNPDLINLGPLTKLDGFREPPGVGRFSGAASSRQNPPNARGSIRCSTLSRRTK
jgi:hypothetical protein